MILKELESEKFRASMENCGGGVSQFEKSMMGLPDGTVTFLFTDIEGSTQLLQRLGAGYATVLADQRAILRDAFAQFRGHEIDTQGDAFFVAFARATDALDAVMLAQHALASHDWSDGATVRVRMALHTGEPQIGATGYVGMDVHRAARICSAGHGGQVLVSQTTFELLRESLPPEVAMRDLGEHRLKDLPHPEHIFQLVFADLPADFPALKSFDSRPNNLPVQLSSFIGRDKELHEITERLDRTRLLTLTGVGGTGKTRLALQLGENVLDNFEDGVWLVELAPVSDARLVPEAIASALHLREQPGRSVIDLLKDYFRSKRSLLILDNCEHLIEGCAETSDMLLRAAPHLKAIATSREALGITGELTFPVPSLALPPALETAPEMLSQFEAVRLFIERMVPAQPGFQLTSQNAPAVVQICQRLDGIPLAIELAAARGRGMSAEQIAQRLNDRFRLLTGGSRTALPRQRTLLATIDWSYKLLSDSERVLLRRLAVFSGGWTIAAAEHAAAGVGIESGEILDLLLHLVDKSLVHVTELGSETRYGMLETIRQYAQERLDDAGEVESVRRRHLEYFVELAEHAEFELHRAEQEFWYKQLDAEQDNIRAALTWALDARAVEQALRIIGALHWFWWVKGYWREAHEWAMIFIAQPEAEARNAIRAQAVGAAGDFAYELGDLVKGEAYLREAMSIGLELGTAGNVLIGYWSIGLAYIEWGRNPELARQYLENGLRAMEHTASAVRWITAWLQHCLAVTFTIQGDYARAREHAEISIEVFRAIGDRYMSAYPLGQLGSVAAREGRLGEARRTLQEALAIERGLGDRKDAVSSLLMLGGIACLEGDYETASGSFAEALGLCRGLGWQAGTASALTCQGFAAQLAGHFDEAEELYRQTLPLCVAFDVKDDLCNALDGLAQVAVFRGDMDTALIRFGASAAARETLGVELWYVMRPAHERALELARGLLGPEAIAAREREARTLTLEQHIEAALRAK